MKSFFIEVKDRIMADTPGFFKKITRIAGGLAAGATALLALNATGAMEVPVFLIGISKYILSMGVVAAAVAESAKEDKPVD